MNTAKRRLIYTRGLLSLTVDGYLRLTPAQRRRMEKKARKRGDYPSWADLTSKPASAD